MAEHNLLGKEGEDEAAAYLVRHGYDILQRNWRYRKLELDIIAQKDGQLIIVEVKTRRNEEFGKPDEAVTYRKIRRIVSATDVYLKRFDIDYPVRFDVISIVGDKAPFQIEHIQQAFLPPVW